MPGHDIIVIGASAGGVERMLELVSLLPADLDAAVFVTLHVSPSAESMLPTLLQRRTRLRVGHGRHDERIERGRIYVAPPDQHLLVRRGRIELSMGPRENMHRPAVDALFRTAAHSYGARVVGVVLSGNLDDGTAGAIEIHRAGGIIIAQDPAEALYASMPQSAIDIAGAEHVAPISEIAVLLDELSRTPIVEEDLAMTPREEASHDTGPDDERAFATSDLESAHAHAERRKERALDQAPNRDNARLGIESDPQIGHGFGAGNAMKNNNEPSSGFTCPECHGALWETADGRLVAYRCRVGHTFTQVALLSEQARALEAAMWTAYTALEEHAAFVHRIVARNQAQGNVVTVSRLNERARDLEQRARLIRNALALGPFAAATGDDQPVSAA
jgi:two-component system chemotaxis response regulator CheB